MIFFKSDEGKYGTNKLTSSSHAIVISVPTMLLQACFRDVRDRKCP